MAKSIALEGSAPSESDIRLMKYAVKALELLEIKHKLSAAEIIAILDLALTIAKVHDEAIMGLRRRN
jgi:hypothetical protein